MQPPPALVRAIDLLTPALLTALIVASSFSSGRALVLDTRAVGAAFGIVLLLVRVPLVVTLLAAAGVVAAVRSLGIE